MTVYIKWIISVAVFANLSASFAQADASVSPSADPETIISSADDREDIMFAMGYSMALSLRFNSGFKPEDMDMILKGLKSGSMGEFAPEDIEKNAEIAINYYNAVLKKSAEDQQAELLAAAAPQIEAGKAFLKELAKDESVKKSAEGGFYYKIHEPGNEKRPEESSQVTFHVQQKALGGDLHFDTKAGEAPVEQSMYELIYGLHLGMKLIGEGGKATFYIPSDLAYGERPPPHVPVQSGALIICDIDLIKVGEPKEDIDPTSGPIPLRPNK